MTTIEILGWNKKHVPGTAWDAHARSELKKRLRRGIKASPAEIRRLARQISDRELLSLHQVFDEAVFGISQILDYSWGTMTRGTDVDLDVKLGYTYSLTASQIKSTSDIPHVEVAEKASQ